MASTSTMLLDQTKWDLVVDADGNIAVASDPYSLAQDAASAIQTWLGEVYYNTTVGLPYRTQILAQRPPLTLLKQQFADAALTVPGVASAKCFVQQFSNRAVGGQVQVTSKASGLTSASSFSTSPGA